MRRPLLQPPSHVLVPLTNTATRARKWKPLPFRSTFTTIVVAMTIAVEAAAATVTSSGSITNNGPNPSTQYTAEYGVTCDAATINSYATAVTACAGLGRGWALATVPSAAAETAVAALSSNVMWLAGSDAAVEGEWRWTHGRLTNALFYKGQYNLGGTCAIPPCSCEGGAYCNWRSSPAPEPNDAGNEDYMDLAPSSGWNDVPASAPSISCAACERSLCDLTLDCNATNTLSVNTSKYFVFGEPCGCVCKKNFTGPRCDDPIVPVYTGTYIAEFGVTCNTATISSYASAATACTSLGSGWALATIPSAVAQAAIATISTDRIWLAGSDAAVEGEWRWTHGRLTNALFYKGQYTAGTCMIPPCSCESGAYCNWNSGEPNDSGGNEDYVIIVPLVVSALRRWNDATPSVSTATCAACERSPCDLTLDCNATNTLSVNTSKYFVFGEPCGCVCKDGFTGPRCDTNMPVRRIVTPSLSDTNTAVIDLSQSTSIVSDSRGVPSASSSLPLGSHSPPTKTSLTVGSDSHSQVNTLASPNGPTTTATVTASSLQLPLPYSTAATTAMPTTATSDAMTSTTSTPTTSDASGSAGSTAAETSITPAALLTTTSTTTTTTTSTATSHISTPPDQNCTEGGNVMVLSSEATLLVFASPASRSSGSSGGAAGYSYMLTFPIPPSITAATVIANTPPFTLVWNLSTTTAAGGSPGEEALAQALRDHVVMFVQCTSQTSLIRCVVPAFAIPDAVVAVAPVRVTMTAAVSSLASLTPPTCPPATTTLRLVATIIVAPPASGGDDTGAASVVLRVVLVAAGAATTAFAILVEPWALEPLVLVGVIDGPCADLAGLRGIARYAVYSLNPFVPLTNDSPSAGGLLLILLVGIVMAANAGFAFARTSSTTSTSDVPRWRRAFGTALFPRVAFSVAVAAVPGVSWALANTIREHAASSTSSTTHALLFIVLGAVYVVLVPAVGALAIFRFVPATFLDAKTESDRQRNMTLSSSSSSLAVRRHVRWLVTPVGSFVSAVPVPSGASSGPSAALLSVHPSSSSPPVTTTNQPPTLHSTSQSPPLPAALNLRGVTAGPRGGSLLFAASALLSVAVFAITAAPPLSSSCATRHYVAAAVLLLTAVVVAAVRPHRTPLTTILTAALLTVVGLCVALVGAAAQNTQLSTTTRSYTIAVFALALVAILVSVGRSVHALWLWRTYDRRADYTSTEANGECDMRELNVVVAAN